ncbi:hypothetical protein MASR1M8_18460 [Thermomonas brevis]
MPRPSGRGEPGAGLDARILAAARAATEAPPSRAPKRRWIAPLGVAATVIVAAGLAWQLLPPSPPPVHDAAEAPATASIVSPAPAARMADPVAPADDAAAVPPPAIVALEPTPARKPSPPPEPPPAPVVADVPAPAPMALPPTAMPAPSPAIVASESAGIAAQDAMRAPPAAAKTADTGTLAMPRAARAVAPQAERAATAAAVADAPDDDVPPATLDAPGVREAWLRRIGELLAEGRTDEARESLAVFRKRYPDAVLPPELQPLEPPPRP